MTAKEKAEYLVNRYDFIHTYDGLDVMDEELTMADRKKCALIALDEIRDNLPLITDIQNHWLDVKKEIEKL